MGNGFNHGGDTNNYRAPYKTKIGVKGNLVEVSSEHRLIPLYCLDNYLLGYGRVNKQGIPIVGEKQEVKTYHIGKEKWTMIVADGEEFSPETFSFLQQLNCREARREGYPYELYFYELVEKRNPNEGFLRNRRNSWKRKKSGLWVPSSARRFR